MQQQDKELTLRWESEKGGIDQIKKLKEQLEAAQTEFDNAQRKGDLETAARLKYGTIADLKKQLSEKEQELAKKGDGTMLHNEVTAEQIAEVVAKWTNIPVAKLLSGERERLMKMEEAIKKRVVGQEEAVTALANAVRRNRAGPWRPESAYRRVSVPWADRRGKNRTFKGACRISL